MTPGRRLLALGAGVATLLAVDWVWWVGPRREALGDARRRLGERRLELAAARREAAARDATRVAVRRTARALRRAEARLPDGRELGALLAAVAREGRRAQLAVVALRPQAERPAADHVEVPVELDLRGTWAATAMFVERLETLGRLVRVSALRLVRARAAGARIVLDGRATLLTYRLAGAGAGRPAPRAATGGEARREPR